MIELNEKTRRVCLNFELDGLHFDAAIDCDWKMHAYETMFMGCHERKETEVPIELVCFDHKEWGMYMHYQQHRNDQFDTINITHVVFEEIVQAAKDWIREMTENED